MVITEAVRFVVRKRRSRLLPTLAAVATLLGGLALPLFNILLPLLTSGQFTGIQLLGLLWPAVYAVLAASTVFYRLKGIRV